MTQKAIDVPTEKEYLQQERSSEIKHEFYRGEIFAMTDASRKHNR